MTRARFGNHVPEEPPTPEYPPIPSNEEPIQHPGRGLSIAAFILGVASIPSAILIGLGLIPGILAIILGNRASNRKAGARGLAMVGMSAGLLGSIVSGLVLLIAFQGIILPMISSSSARGSVGQVVPFAFTSLDGTPIESTALAGKPIVVDVWATWCGPCVATIPALDRLAQEEDVMVIGLTFEDPTHVAEWVARRRAQGKGPNYPIVAQGKAGIPAVFTSVSAYPTIFFLDDRGIVHDVQIGAHGYDTLRAAVRASSTGTTGSQETTNQ